MRALFNFYLLAMFIVKGLQRYLFKVLNLTYMQGIMSYELK